MAKLLFAYNFPERQYKELLKAVKQKTSSIQSEPVAWPHVSVAYIEQDVPKELRQQIVAMPRPTFKIVSIKVFDGQASNPMSYLVLTLDKPKEYQDVQRFIAQKLDVTVREDHTPHVSLLQFPKENAEQMRQLLPEIEGSIKVASYPFAVSNPAFWENFAASDIYEHINESVQLSALVESLAFNPLQEKTLYHGTNKLFKEFDPKASTRNGTVYGNASYFTASQKVASDYAGDDDNSNVHIVDIDTDTSRFWDVSDYEEYASISKKIGYKPLPNDKQRNWFFVLARQMEQDENLIDAFDYADHLASKLQELGYAGVMIPSRMMGKESADMYVVYDKKAIKHKFGTELDEELQLKPIKWIYPTDEQLQDEFHEGEIDNLFLDIAYPKPEYKKQAFEFFKNNLKQETIDPKKLDPKNKFRFDFDSYKQFRDQVTRYGGAKDPDSMVRKVQAGGSLPMPVVVKQRNGTYLLGGGATRVSIARLAGQMVEALVIDEDASLKWRALDQKRIIDSFVARYNAQKELEFVKKFDRSAISKPLGLLKKDLESFNFNDTEKFHIVVLSGMWEKYLKLLGKPSTIEKDIEDLLLGEANLAYRKPTREVRTPSPHLPLAFLKKLQDNYYISETGIEYVSDEVDQLIAQKQGDLGKRFGIKKRAVKYEMKPISDDEFFDQLGTSPELHVVHTKGGVEVFDPFGDLVMKSHDGQFFSSFGTVHSLDTKH